VSFKALANKSLGICLTALGETVSYVPGGVLLNAYNLRAILDNVYDEADPNTGATITTEQPIAGVRRSDMQADPLPSDELHADGVKYRVEDSQEDGQGGITLMLVKVGTI